MYHVVFKTNGIAIDLSSPKVIWSEISPIDIENPADSLYEVEDVSILTVQTRSDFFISRSICGRWISYRGFRQL